MKQKYRNRNIKEKKIIDNQKKIFPNNKKKKRRMLKTKFYPVISLFQFNSIQFSAYIYIYTKYLCLKFIEYIYCSIQRLG